MTFLRYAAASHAGFVRPNNEDSLYAGGTLLAVADGVGGAAAGEVASSIVIHELAALDTPDRAGDVLDDLAAAIERASGAVAQHVRDNPQDAGIGTTVTALLFAGDHAGLVHVGDSRAYQLRDGALRQITKDETFVQSLVDEGRLAPEAVSTHPRRSVVLRALDGRPLSPVLRRVDVRPGDRYLVCSDGVSDVVRADELRAALLADDPQESAFPIVLAAMRAGSADNVSAVAAFVADRDFGYNIPLQLGGAAPTTA